MRFRSVVLFVLVLLPELVSVATLVTVDVPNDIAPSGSDHWVIGASESTPITVGYARLQPAPGTTAPAGTAIFSRRVNGVLTGETSVAASPLIQEGRIYCSFSEVVKTGIAIANPNNQVASISFYFTDPDGNTFGSGTTTIPPGGQIVRFLNEAPFAGFLNNVPFNGPAAARSFTFTSSVRRRHCAPRIRERTIRLSDDHAAACPNRFHIDRRDSAAAGCQRRWMADGTSLGESNGQPDLWVSNGLWTKPNLLNRATILGQNRNDGTSWLRHGSGCRSYHAQSRST